jgi:P4 family phage/plasmid primase-like protien
MNNKSCQGSSLTILSEGSSDKSPDLDLREVNDFLSILGYQEGEKVYFNHIGGKDSFPVMSQEVFPLRSLPFKDKRNCFFVVNGQGYKDEDICEGRAFFVEFDDLSIAEQFDLIESKGLPDPSVVLFSGNKSCHFYWVLSEFLARDSWLRVQKLLVDFTGSDPKIKNINRLMRVPNAPYFDKDKLMLTGSFSEILRKSDKRYNGVDFELLLRDLSQGSSLKNCSDDGSVYGKVDDESLFVKTVHDLGFELPLDGRFCSALRDEFLMLVGLSDERNNKLNESCFNLGQLVAEGLDEELVRSLMFEASKINGKVDRSGSLSVNSTINSGVVAGKKFPRSLREVKGDKKGLKERIRDYKSMMKPESLIDVIAVQYQDRLVFDERFSQWYFYDDSLHFFDKKCDLRVKSFLREDYKRLSRNYCKVYDIPEECVCHNPSSRVVNELYFALQSESLGLLSRDSKGLLPLANGMLNLKSGELTCHSPIEKNIYCLPHAYDSSLGCDRFLSWLHEGVGDKGDVKIIQAFFYASIVGMPELQKFLEVVGRPRTGKGTLMRVLQGLLGKQNCASTSIRDIEENRFAIASLIDKRLICISEGVESRQRVNNFLKLTGQDEFMIEEKGKQMVDGACFNGMVMVVGNSPLCGKDPTKALDSRRITVKFDKPHLPQERRNLLSIKSDGSLSGEFAEEMSGILNWVLSIGEESARNVLLSPESYNDSYKSNQLEEDLERDIVARFCEVRLVADPDGCVSVKDLWQKFIRFCDDQDESVFMSFKNSRSFSSALKNLLNLYNVPFRFKRSTSGWFFYGFSFKSDSSSLGILSQQVSGNPRLSDLTVSC